MNLKVRPMWAGWCMLLRVSEQRRMTGRTLAVLVRPVVWGVHSEVGNYAEVLRTSASAY